MARPVIVDCDPGCDDAVALLAATGSGAIDLRAVTTVAGNTTVGNATRNALAALELAGESIPVAEGCDRPLVEPLETAESIQGPGGIRGDPPDPAAAPVGDHAAEVIVETARSADAPALIALGPLTNVALALALEPGLPDLLGEVYVMGGAAFVPGNRTPAAEANFYTDPAAARRVVGALEPTLVGLDVTRDAWLPAAAIDRFAGADDPAAATVGAWLDYYPEDVLAERDYPSSPQHDAVAVAAAVTDLLAVENHPVEVVTSAECRGALLADPAGTADLGARAGVAVDLDAGGFREWLLGRLEQFA